MRAIQSTVVTPSLLLVCFSSLDISQRINYPIQVDTRIASPVSSWEEHSLRRRLLSPRRQCLTQWDETAMAVIFEQETNSSGSPDHGRRRDPAEW